MKKPFHYYLLLWLIFSNSLLLIAQDEQPSVLKPVGDEAYEAILQFYQYGELVTEALLSSGYAVLALDYLETRQDIDSVGIC